MHPRLSLSAPIFIVAAAIAVIVTTSGGSTSKAQPLASANASISVKQTALGQMLTDANGRTLYLFAPDKRDMSTLSAAGRSIWPPFTSTRRPGAMGGLQTGQIGAVAGASGSAQVTYDGHPPYYFVGDRRPGETAGQGLNEFGGRWYVLSTMGGAITAATQPGASGSSGGAPSYGY
jgi:predicted lipoprotein with Yx(FWY)xxD motif